MSVPIDRGMMRGRDVLIHIAMLPVTLAIAGTLIGLVLVCARTPGHNRSTGKVPLDVILKDVQGCRGTFSRRVRFGSLADI